MESQSDIDILFQRRQEALRNDLISLCGLAGLPKERVDVLFKSINALCGLYLLKQLKDSEILSQDAVTKFAHID